MKILLVTKIIEIIHAAKATPSQE